MSRTAGSGAEGPASRGPQYASVSGPARSASFLNFARVPVAVEGEELRVFRNPWLASAARLCILHIKVPNALAQYSNWVWANLVVKVII